MYQAQIDDCQGRENSGAGLYLISQDKEELYGL
jgi:hypothetical protein